MLYFKDKTKLIINIYIILLFLIKYTITFIILLALTFITFNIVLLFNFT
jgi:hypothetical protein